MADPSHAQTALGARAASDPGSAGLSIDLSELPGDVLARLEERARAPDRRLTVGRYVIVGELGRGGMGVVYEAWDPRIERRVAIKTIEPELVPEEDRDEVIERFRRETKVVGRLHHPGIVTIYDYGEDQGGAGGGLGTLIYYYVMEYLEGHSLARILRERRTMPDIEAVSIVAEIGEALQVSHAAGIIHRDIKPSNIFLKNDREAVLLDFGIAKTASVALTRQGQILGTPSYLAPERLREKEVAVDGRADIFSLGVLLFTMLTGEAPFVGADVYDVIDKIAKVSHPKLARTTPSGQALSRVIDRMLAKRPDDRYPSAGEAAQALRGVLGLLKNTNPEIGDLVSGAVRIREPLPDALATEIATPSSALAPVKDFIGVETSGVTEAASGRGSDEEDTGRQPIGRGVAARGLDPHARPEVRAESRQEGRDPIERATELASSETRARVADLLGTRPDLALQRETREITRGPEVRSLPPPLPSVTIFDSKRPGGGREALGDTAPARAADDNRGSEAEDTYDPHAPSNDETTDDHTIAAGGGAAAGANGQAAGRARGTPPRAGSTKNAAAPGAHARPSPAAKGGAQPSPASAKSPSGPTPSPPSSKSPSGPTPSPPSAKSPSGPTPSPPSAKSPSGPTPSPPSSKSPSGPTPSPPSAKSGSAPAFSGAPAASGKSASQRAGSAAGPAKSPARSGSAGAKSAPPPLPAPSGSTRSKEERIQTEPVIRASNPEHSEAKTENDRGAGPTVRPAQAKRKRTSRIEASLVDEDDVVVKPAPLDTLKPDELPTQTGFRLPGGGSLSGSQSTLSPLPSSQTVNEDVVRVRGDIRVPDPAEPSRAGAESAAEGADARANGGTDGAIDLSETSGPLPELDLPRSAAVARRTFGAARSQPAGRSARAAAPAAVQVRVSGSALLSADRLRIVRRRGFMLFAAMLAAIAVGLFLGRMKQRSIAISVDLPSEPAKQNAVEPPRALKVSAEGTGAEPELVRPRTAAELVQDATAAFAEGRLAKAERLFESAARAAPERTPLRAQAMLGRADALQKLGGKDAAIQLYRGVLSETPKSKEADEAKAALASLGVTLEPPKERPTPRPGAAGQGAPKRSEMKDTSDAAASGVGPRSGGGVASSGEGKTTPVPVAITPGMTPDEKCLALAAKHINDPKEAVRAFTQLTKDEPKSSCVYWHLGNSYAKLHDDRAALASYRRYLELRPDAQNRPAVDARIKNLAAKVEER